MPRSTELEFTICQDRSYPKLSVRREDFLRQVCYLYNCQDLLFAVLLVDDFVSS